MTDLRGQWRDVGAALFADEVGIEYGIYGAYRLKSAYQPIFAPQEGHLAPVAVEAVAQPQLRGRPARLGAFFESVAPGDRPFVERLLLRLHLGNYRNLDVAGLGLFFTYGPMASEDPQRALAEIRLMARHRGELELDAADMLVCEIADPARPEDRLPARIAREMRRNGLAVALGGFGAGLAAQERLALLKPDIVRINGGWFAELCRYAAAARLFRPLLDLLHGQGAKVLVEGIEAPPQLRLALESGADFVQGPLLAPPALAGTRFGRQPLDIERLLGAGRKVIPLFGRAPG
ncbi:EAL domain-containing protein (putative c-di-GMP-specific phosphodiesterase class I) [Aquamicrobium terrae]